MGLYTGDYGLFTFPEFKNRGIIKLAPDALVFISGNMETSVIAPVSGATQRADFRDGITSISVQNSVDPPGSSSASIELFSPIFNEKSRYWVQFRGYDGRLYRRNYFVPMMEVKIFFKGRYLVGDGYGSQPKYYPAFWGFITNVEESYNGGAYKIALHCADMLSWWGRIQVAYRPSVESDVFTGYLQNLTAYSSRYVESNAFQIIYSLMTQMGYENFVTPSWLGQVTPSSNIFSRAEMNVIWGGILEYWKKRWAGLVDNKGTLQRDSKGNVLGVNNLKMYGARGNLINDPQYPDSGKLEKDKQQNLKESSHTNKGKEASKGAVQFYYSPDDKYVREFPVFHEFSQMGQLDQAEYQDKLQIATEVKTRVEYEFYQDVNGNFIFKPPFYNLNVKNVLPYRMKPSDIISYSFGVNSDEITTCLEVQIGIQRGINDTATTFPNMIGYHIDMDLAKKYGHRFKKISLFYLNETRLAKAIAVGHLTLQNVKATVGSITIPGRPELKLGFPVYVEHRDSFHYVKSINHSFDYGGSFTTALSLEAERSLAFQYDESTRDYSIMKNKISLLKEPICLPPDKSLDKEKTIKQQAAESKNSTYTKMTEMSQGSSFISAMGTGRYALADGDFASQTTTPNSVPYSDEEGYKVIGSYRYGRGIIVKPGFMLTPPESNTATQTEQQRQAVAVTNMKTLAEEEGAAIGNYFKANMEQYKENGGIEVMIPPYLDLDKEVFKDSNSVSSITLATENFESGEMSATLSNTLNAGGGNVTSTTQQNINIHKAAASRQVPR
jgi:hypothetical protein